MGLPVTQRETDILEYKSGEWVVGKGNNEIADELARNIVRDKGNAKIIIIGISEDLQRIIPVNCTRFRSERIDTIEEKLKENLKSHYVKVLKVDFSPTDCILLIVAIRLTKTLV